jgi:hypothetical protein
MGYFGFPLPRLPDGQAIRVNDKKEIKSFPNVFIGNLIFD